MKTLTTPLLASVLLAVVGFMPPAFAGNPSPREVEENLALVRAGTPAKNSTCKLCAIASNSAYQRSPRAIEENPELARTATCAAEAPVKAQGVPITTRTPTWPRILETR